MIDIIVTELMIEKQTKDKEDAIEIMLRKGWKGFENYSDSELKKIIDEYDQNRIEGLLLVAEILRESKTAPDQKQN